MRPADRLDPADGTPAQQPPPDRPVPHALAGRVASTRLGRKTASGAVYSTVSRLVVQVLQFVSTVVLARLLTPNDYGLVAIVVSFTGFAQLFTDLGLSAAIVQRPELDEDDLSSAFWLNALSGFALTGLFVVLAHPIADFYHRPRLVPLIVLGSLAFSLSMGSVHSALLQRHLRFRAIGGIEALAMLLQITVSISCAAAGVGATSLILGTLTQATFTTVAMWVTVRWFPRRFWRRSALLALWRFSGHLFGFNVVNYWSRNADDLLIGKFSTASALAFYSRAYQLMLLPVQQVTIVIGRVLFPALAALHGDIPRTREAYLRVLRVMVAVAAPISVGLAASATAFIDVVYGHRWHGVAPLLALLALSCPAQLIFGSTGAVYQALGRTDVQFRRGLINAVLTVAAIVVGVHWGAFGVAVALLIKFWVLLPLMTQGCWTLIGLSLRDGLRSVWFTLLATGVMGAAVVAVGYPLRDEGKPVVLVVQVATGAVVYALLMAVGARPLLRDVRRLTA